MSPGSAWEGRVSPGYSSVGSAVQVFGAFNPGNENAGGSAICIHKDILPDDAIVTHMITCPGRDLFANIQSGRQSLVIVNVHFEPEFTLRQLRERIRLINPHWPSYPNAVGIIFGVTSTSVNQKKDDSTCGTKPSPTVTRERLPYFIPFSTRS